MADVEDMTDVIELFAKNYTVTRTARGSGYNASGAYVAGAVTTVTVRGHVQPKSGASQDRTESGVETDDLLNFWCTSALYAANSATYMPDVVTVKGQAYEVDSVDDWGDAGNFWKATLSRKD
jgi:hypothetical protein